MNTIEEVPEWLLSSGELSPCEPIGKKKKVSFIEKTIEDITKLIKEVVFSEEISFRDGYLQKLDPRVKIITMLMLILSVMLIKNIFVLVALYLVSCALAKLSCITMKFYFKRVWLVIPLFTGIMVLPSLFNYVRAGDSLITLINFGYKVHLGPFIFPSELSVTKQGFSGAILLITRVGLSVSLALLLTTTTRWTSLLKAFRVLFLPKIFITTLEMCYRYIFVLLNITSDMFTARKSRTFGKVDTKEGRRFVSNAIGSLFGKSYALSEEVYGAMLSRGYNGEPVIMNRFKFTMLDFQWLLYVAICILAAFGGRLFLDKAKIMELKDVSFEYTINEAVLKNINLDIYSGEKIVILGANGSGKSTLLKILNGLIYANKGEYKAFSQLVTEEALNDEQFSKAFRQRIGFIFQNSDSQLFSTNVWEEIAFGPLQMKLNFEEVKTRVNGVIQMLGLEALTDRPPYKLSGGEKKKVAIASVLSINPEILILDEPTNGLDPRTQRWLINLLIKLNDAGKTLITCTHNLDIVEEIADRVIVFSEEHGIMAQGTPKEILLNKKLLLAVNLIDEHYHRHYHDLDLQEKHSHYHSHE